MELNEVISETLVTSYFNSLIETCFIWQFYISPNCNTDSIISWPKNVIINVIFKLKKLIFKKV